MHLARPLCIAGLLAVCALTGLGCGGDDDAGQKPPPVAREEQFPSAEGKTLADLRNGLGESGPVLAPAVSQLTSGGRPNRFGFGLFDRARAQIADASVAVYVAPAGGGEATGPHLARWESLEVDPAFQSQGVQADPDSAKSVYVAELEFAKPGSYEVLGLARLDDRLVVATPAGPALAVVKDDPVPDVGDPAPRTHTPTKTDVGGDLAAIDTRVPPSTMHDADFADVLGRKPAVLLFATPALCQSRVCGPVVDIVEQVKAEHEDDAEFIHMEIFRDNTIEKGYRPQVREWRLPTEPWLFAVDREGRVAARLEGAFSADELKAAIKRATRG